MTIANLPYLIFIGLLSWIIGLFLNRVLKSTSFYPKLSNYNFIQNKSLNQLLGIKALSGLFQSDAMNLEVLKTKVKQAEIRHLIGFVFILVLVTVHFSLGIKPHLNVPLLIVNVIFNLYPLLVQQERRRSMVSMTEG